jgi:monomeric isocitrate dehydrogenase
MARGNLAVVEKGKVNKKAAKDCRHHWVIESAVGPVSRGVCRKCKATKSFKNYIEANPWTDSYSSSESGRHPLNRTGSDLPEEGTEE